MARGMKADGADGNPRRESVPGEQVSILASSRRPRLRFPPEREGRERFGKRAGENEFKQLHFLPYPRSGPVHEDLVSGKEKQVIEGGEERETDQRSIRKACETGLGL